MPALPPVGASVPFMSFHRQPRKLASSRVDLPNGFLVDLRYSGPINVNANTAGTASGADRRSWFDEIILPPDPNLNAGARWRIMKWPTRRGRFRSSSIRTAGVDRVLLLQPLLSTSTTSIEFEEPRSVSTARNEGRLWFY